MSTSAQATYPENERLYGIAAVARLTRIKPFVLRYWESEFPMLQPVKSHNGHRMYRQQDVEMVLEIKRLLHEEGFTIAGARRHLEDLGGNGNAQEPEERQRLAVVEEENAQLNRKMLLELRESLRSFLTLLERK